MKELERDLARVLTIVIIALTAIFFFVVKLNAGDTLIKNEKEYMLFFKAVERAKLKVQNDSNSSVKKCKVSPKALFKKIEIKKIKKDTNTTTLFKRLMKKASIYKKSRGYRAAIVNAVIKSSKEYNLNPKKLMAVLMKESSLYPLLKHAPIKIKINGKRISTRAVGLGGVVFEVWKDDLKKLGIYSKSQLFNVSNNVRATAYILNKYKHAKKIREAEDKFTSALYRYFGVVRNKKGELIKATKNYPKNVYKIAMSI